MCPGKMEGIATPSVESTQKTWLYFVKLSGFLINFIVGTNWNYGLKILVASLDIKRSLLYNIAMV